MTFLGRPVEINKQANDRQSKAAFRRTLSGIEIVNAGLYRPRAKPTVNMADWETLYWMKRNLKKAGKSPAVSPSIGRRFGRESPNNTGPAAPQPFSTSHSMSPHNGLPASADRRLRSKSIPQRQLDPLAAERRQFRSHTLLGDAELNDSEDCAQLLESGASVAEADPDTGRVKRTC
eukprot:m.127651 g.127651  ORF g.127651 m.127651 type:complete len:176 (-) comp13854_c0_seq2:1738-2265(-)